MKIYKLSYFIDNARAYIIDGDNEIIPVPVHIDGIIDRYDLTSEIESNFESNFGEKLDWDKDWETVVEYVKDFMLDHHIFCVVEDIRGKQVYVRPNMGETPSPPQIKALSDWAIEKGYNEEIIIDHVVASQKEKLLAYAESNNHIPIFSQSLKKDPKRVNSIEEIAKRVRRWAGDDIKAQCLLISKKLQEELKKSGYNAALVMGTYYVDNPDPEAYSDWDADDFNGEDEMEEATRHPLHYWVEVDGMIVDVSADQFNDEIDDSPVSKIIIGAYSEYPRYTPQNRRYAAKNPDNGFALDEKARKTFSISSSVDGSLYLLSNGDGIYFTEGDDHRYIAEIFQNGIPAGYYNKPGNYSGYMLAFMGEADALRVRKTSSGLAISFINPASYAQANKVLETSAKEVYVDKLGKDYSVIDSKTFSLPEDKESLKAFLLGRAFNEDI